jgi:hypothetical protein
VIGVHKRDKGRCAVHAESGFFVIDPTVMDIIDDALYMFVRKARQRLEATGKEIQHVTGYGIVKGGHGAGQKVRNKSGSSGTRGFLCEGLPEEVPDDNR